MSKRSGGGDMKEDKYSQGICEFPDGAESVAAQRLAEQLAAIALLLAATELCEQLDYLARRAA